MTQPKDQNSNDDFFRLLEMEQKRDSLGTDEILFRNEQGNLKILRGGEIFDFESAAGPKKPLLSAEPGAAAADKKPLLTVGQERKLLIDSLKVREPKALVIPLAKPSKVLREVENVVRRCGIKFNDQAMESRFRNIIASRLKEIRTIVQAKEALKRSVESGGLGFTEDQALAVMKIVKDELELIQKRRGELASFRPYELSQSQWVPFGKHFTPEMDDINTPPPPSEKYSALKADESKSAMTAPVKKMQTALVRPPQPAGQAEQKPVEESEFSGIDDGFDALFSAAPANPRPELKTPVKVGSVETKIKEKKGPDKEGKSDLTIKPVAYRPVLVDPVEELRRISLLDFRRLGGTGEMAVKKIMEKLDLLEQISFAKRFEGITAWKESEVYKLYLDLGEESINKNLPIEEIISRRRQAGTDYLSKEEIEAIIDLNEKIRY